MAKNQPIKKYGNGLGIKPFSISSVLSYLYFFEVLLIILWCYTDY